MSEIVQDASYACPTCGRTIPFSSETLNYEYHSIYDCIDHLKDDRDRLAALVEIAYEYRPEEHIRVRRTLAKPSRWLVQKNTATGHTYRLSEDASEWTVKDLSPFSTVEAALDAWEYNKTLQAEAARKNVEEWDRRRKERTP